MICPTSVSSCLSFFLVFSSLSFQSNGSSHHEFSCLLIPLVFILMTCPCSWWVNNDFQEREMERHKSNRLSILLFILVPGGLLFSCLCPSIGRLLSVLDSLSLEQPGIHDHITYNFFFVFQESIRLLLLLVHLPVNLQLLRLVLQ